MWMGALLMGVLLGAGSRVLSQEKPQQVPDMQEMMRKWVKAMTPGENHRKLDYFIGDWDHTMKIWMAGPDAPPTETKGKSSAKWVLDGRFILGETDGEMLMPDETGKMKSIPHRGMGLTGYDNYRNMYVGTWADNMGTTILNMAGGVDPTGKIFTSYGEMDEPMLDIRGRMVKYVTTIKDKDNYIFEIFDLHAGPNYKVLQIDYKRK
jgi:hypothetical protein